MANEISLSESGKLCKIKDIKRLRNFLALFQDLISGPYLVLEAVSRNDPAV